jgi:hypothetical protein
MGKTRRVGWFNTNQLAIESAYGHIDDSCVVYRVGFSSLGDTISKDQFVRVYALMAARDHVRRRGAVVAHGKTAFRKNLG